MCGIAGIVEKNGVRVSQDLLKKMAEQMTRRGPDAEGFINSDNIGFAHRRLKIIDLSDAANQPLWNETQDVAVVCNGEIYNFKELRRELIDAGHEFRTDSDSEVIVHAYEEWGERSFLRFNGMFSFAVLDKRSGKNAVHLVRDRFGIKPLFYCHKDGKLAFASEMKPLLQVPWIEKNIEDQTVYYFLKFSHIPTPMSILSDVKQLSPGTWLTFENATLQQKVYWDPVQLSNRKTEKKSEEDWLEELESVLNRVVSRQTVSDVPLGCFLSGGIDSSLITMSHAAVSNNKIKTFTIGYKESEFDESPFAKQVSQIFGTEHYDIQVEPKDVFSLIRQIPVYFDQPFADPTLLPTLLLAKKAREQVTVALSGDGGDELFFGYSYQQALRYLFPLTKVPQAFRRPFFETFGNFFRRLDPKIKKMSDILQFKDKAELLQYFIGTVGPIKHQEISDLLVNRPSTDRPLFNDHLQGFEGLDWNQTIEQIFVRTFLLDTVLAKTDRSGMAWGLEARVPFLDNEMIDFASRVPMNFKLRNGVKKYLLRKLSAQKMPASISERTKQGFSVPMRDWLRNDLKYLVDEYLGSGRLRSEGYFNPEKIEALVKQHMEGYANHSHLLWSLISFQIWRETYL